MARHARTVTRRKVVLMPDGTLDRIYVRCVVMPDGTEVPVDEIETEPERTRFRTLTPKKKRRKPRSGLGAAVVGMVTL